MDLIIALALFLAALLIFYKYSTNIAPHDSLEDLIIDVKNILSSLMSAGYPTNWSVSNVNIVGITNGDYNLNTTKVQKFYSINYNLSRQLLNIKNHYLIFFEDRLGKRKSIGGVCYIGYLNGLSLVYNVSMAYYYYDDEDMYMKDIMRQEFNADIFCEKDCEGDIDDLLSKIDDYDIIILEDAKINKAGSFSKRSGILQTFVNNGGFLILSEDVSTSQGDSMLGASFYKWAGQSKPYVFATVKSIDPYLNLQLNEELNFTQAGYVKDNTSQAVNFKKIAEFHRTSQIDGEAAAVSWSYGSGRVYYFSDIDANYLGLAFKNKVKELLQASAGCGEFDINAKRLINVYRLAIYESDILKMRLYVWQ